MHSFMHSSVHRFIRPSIRLSPQQQKHRYYSCEGQLKSITGKCGIVTTGGGFLFQGEQCQDPTAKRKMSSRCWQSTLQKAIAICTRRVVAGVDGAMANGAWG